MNITDFLAIGVVGALISLGMQYFKTTSGFKAKLLTIGLSIVVGGAYVYLRETIWWETIVGVLAAASTVYSLFLKGTMQE